MKTYLRLLMGLALLAFWSAPAPAQSDRLDSLSGQLDEQSVELAERSYDDYNNGMFRSRSDVEALYLAQQFSASARVFRRMVTNRRRESELRDAASILADLIARADRDFSRRSRWSDVRRTFEEIQRELNVVGGGGGFGGGRRDDDNSGRTTGRLRWRGTVDDNVQLVIRDDRVEVRTIGGSEYSDATYNFTSPLPRRRGVNVTVNKLNGRGDVRVLQQPSRDNDFTAVVEIRDTKGGAREYEIEVVW